VGTLNLHEQAKVGSIGWRRRRCLLDPTGDAKKQQPTKSQVTLGSTQDRRPRNVRKIRASNRTDRPAIFTTVTQPNPVTRPGTSFPSRPTGAGSTSLRLISQLTFSLAECAAGRPSPLPNSSSAVPTTWNGIHAHTRTLTARTTCLLPTASRPIPAASLRYRSNPAGATTFSCWYNRPGSQEPPSALSNPATTDSCVPKGGKPPRQDPRHQRSEAHRGLRSALWSQTGPT